MSDDMRRDDICTLRLCGYNGQAQRYEDTLKELEEFKANAEMPGPCLRSPAPERLALEALRRFVGAYPSGVNPGLDQAYSDAIDVLSATPTATAQDGARDAQGMTKERIAEIRAREEHYSLLRDRQGVTVTAECLNEIERLQAISATPAKQPEAKAGPWVRGDEGLPKSGCVVLLRKDEDCFTGRFIGRGTFDTEKGIVFKSGIHWMEIPPLKATTHPIPDDSKAGLSALREIKEAIKAKAGYSGYGHKHCLEALEAVEAICDRALVETEKKKT